MCTDVSNAGPREGLEGDTRSGFTWREMFRVVRELRPRFVVVENVAALLNRGMGRVLGDLASVGYDAEWEVIPACAFGAAHTRERVFVVAYPVQPGFQVGREAGADFEDARIFKEGFGLAVRTAVQGVECRGDSVWRGSVHGIPQRVDRIKSLGNAVYPPAVYPIFEAIARQEAA